VIVFYYKENQERFLIRKELEMTNSIFGQGFATLSDYPKGLMNLCPCGQVVLAPALYHEGCEATHTA
jgi:hypothetical protein